MNRTVTLSALCAAIGIVIVGAATAGEQPASEAYAPGFGEFMAATQLRHAKLWFAGEAQNWELADYELGEIREGLEDAVRLHPTHKDVPVAAMIEEQFWPAFDAVSKAVEAKDKERFVAGFDSLTVACNRCHKAASYGFIKVQRPNAPPMTNQDFSPAR